MEEKELELTAHLNDLKVRCMKFKSHNLYFSYLIKGKIRLSKLCDTFFPQ
jgi:hypothetical protein